MSPGRRALAALLAASALAGGCIGTRERVPPGEIPTLPPVVPPVAPLPAPAPRPSEAELLALPDAVPRSEPRARLGNPPFYEVFGQRYTVLDSSAGYLERGVASWYGPDFHGVRTSVGEPYDMYSMTAAHRTLPLPAYARVTNLRNGRSVVVRINDRGPFKANRIIDLSYAAALKLDMVRDGTTLVEVRALEADGPPPPAPPPGEIYAQAGAFAVADNAERLRERLAGAGIAGVFVRSDTVAGRPLYRVRIGPVESVAAYDALVLQLHALGVSGVALAPN
ncbi:MAG TPA: septal ring lytic transglycosylase RlpA family protein [Steroidobacteraceae bacterium]|nr:septal ring lytic transglycosylase RlpA family protein [Steroidobacteraceae bacterium]